MTTELCDKLERMERLHPRADVVVLLVTVAAVSSMAVWVLVSTTEGPTPPFLEADVATAPVERLPGEVIEIAGSGSNLPLTRLLVERFAQRSPGQRLRVHTSIGSTGGIRAVYDGAIDIGLASRPLRAAERAGLRAVPYARVPIVLAAEASVPDDGLTGAELVEIALGRRTAWSDGRAITLVLRELDDSSQTAAALAIPGFGEAVRAAIEAEHFRVVYTDAAMEEALRQTDGALGILDLGAIVGQKLRLKALALDGVAPSPEAVASGRYPLYKDLAFVVRSSGVAERAARFFDFVASPEGASIIRESGYQVLPIGR